MKVCTYCGKPQVNNYTSCCGEMHFAEETEHNETCSQHKSVFEALPVLASPENPKHDAECPYCGDPCVFDELDETERCPKCAKQRAEDIAAESTTKFCDYCNGSGEGMHDGARCGRCNGSGEERSEEGD